MSNWKVVMTKHAFASVEDQRKMLEEAGASLQQVASDSPAEIIAAARDADALIVQLTQINKEIIESLERCRIIVRCGIGVDNFDLAAAKAKNIPICNVPDYCIDEVADHSLALALALGRQVPQVEKRTLGGVWKVTPDAPLPAFREMTFATAGFGRIARATLERARPFQFKLAAYDPYVPAEQFEQMGVQQLSLDDLFANADILSLHSPLTPDTHHMVNAARLSQMKKTAILVNTARGPLVDSMALASALNAGEIASAGLDVFDPEPLPDDHPLRICPNALLTSHVAWYSESSVPEVQKKTTEEVLRGLRGEPLKNQVNK